MKQHRMMWSMGAWHCPECRRQLRPESPTSLNLIVVVEGDTTAVHYFSAPTPPPLDVCPPWLLPTLEEIARG